MGRFSSQSGLSALPKDREQAGYSIFELIIYIALFIVISLVLVRSLLTVMKTYAAAQSYRALQNNGELAMERITRELREGTSVSASSCATTPGTLSISGTDSSGAAHTEAFSVSSGVLQLATNGGSASALTTSEVTVSSLTFCSLTTSVGTGIKTMLTLTTTRGVISSATFYSTILLRGQ